MIIVININLQFNYRPTVICSPQHIYLACRDALVKVCPTGSIFFSLRTPLQFTFFVVLFYYFVLFINYYHTIQFILVTSRTRSLTTFLKHWEQECFMFCAQVPKTLFVGRTLVGLIPIVSQSREILIARLLHPYT